MSQLFISCSGHDEDDAYELAEWLNRSGWPSLHMSQAPVWKEAEQAEAPENLESIASRCEAALFIITPDWVSSEWCQAQYDLFSTLNKPMVGLVTRVTEASAIPPEFEQEWLLLDFTNGPASFANLVQKTARSRTKKPSAAHQHFEELRRFLLSIGLDADYLQWPPQDEPDSKPYRGLLPYRHTDGGIFFGRDQQIAEAVDAARALRKRGGCKVLLISGDAGVGKTSLMQAGLLSRLSAESDHFSLLPVVHPATGAVYGEHGLLAALGDALGRAGVSNHPQRLSAALEATNGLAATGTDLTGLLEELIDTCLFERRPAYRPPTIVLPVDQLGDLFGQGDLVQNREFIMALNTFCNQTRLSILLIATLHSGEVQRARRELFSAFAELTELTIPPLPLASFPQILQRPLERFSQASAKIEMEGLLIEKILEDVEKTHDQHSHMKVSLALKTLFERHNAKGKLTLESYKEIGGIEGVLHWQFGQIARGTSDGPTFVTNPQQRIFDSVSPWMMRYSTTCGGFTGQAASWSQLPVDLHPVIEKLLHRDLLEPTSLTVSHNRGQTVLHEEAVRAPGAIGLETWSPVSGLLREQLSLFKTLNDLSDSSAKWFAAGASDEGLDHSGESLLSAETATNSSRLRGYFPAHQLDYLQACREQVNRLLEIKVKRQGRATGWMHGATLVCMMGMVFAIGYAHDRATETDLAGLQKQVAERTAEKARQNAASAANMQLLAEKNLAQTSQLQRDTLKNLQQSTVNHARSILTLPHLPGSPATPELEANALLETVHLLNQAGTGADLIATANSRLNTLQAKDRLLAVVNTGEAYENAKFSPDRSRFVALSRDGDPKIFDVRSGVLLHELKGHTSSINSAAFSPDGTKLITGSFDSTARIWNVANGRELSILKGHALSVGHVAISPDGKLAVTASLDSTAAVWDIETQALLFRLVGHEGNVNDAAFSHDSRLIVTAANDARLWDASTGKLVATFSAHSAGHSAGHSESVNTARFSADDRSIITASDDGTARVWDRKTGRMSGVLEPKGGPVKTATFRPDGKAILVVASDSIPTLWDTITFQQIARLVGHHGTIASAAFNSQGSLVVTASSDGTARLWDGADGGQIDVLPDYGYPIAGAAFSEDGNQIITASDAVRLWSARRTRPGNSASSPDELAATPARARARQLTALTDKQREELHLSRDLLTVATDANNDCDALGIDPLDTGTTGPRVELSDFAKSAGKAISICEAAARAEPGSAHFLYQTGRAYRAARNTELAAKHFSDAADAGHALAKFSHGQMIEETAASRLEFVAAINHYHSALEAGFALAAHRLGQMYWNGTGTSENRAKALAIWRRGAELDDPSCHFELGRLFATGSLINRNPVETRDPATAAHHFSEATRLYDKLRQYEKAELARNRRGTIVRNMENDGMAGYAQEPAASKSGTN